MIHNVLNPYQNIEFAGAEVGGVESMSFCDKIEMFVCRQISSSIGAISWSK